MLISKVTHLNSATLKPYYPKLTGIVWCMLVQHKSDFILVDTGFGTRDFTHPTLVMRFFQLVLGVKPDPEQAIINQMKSLNLQTSDIKHIILTHTHLDHAGGLRDFPEAQIHIFSGEYDSLQHPRRLLDFGHIKNHFIHKPNWVIHARVDTTWFGFDAITALPGVLLIPLPGHTSGHCGVAVKTTAGWILHAGDAISPFHAATDPDGRGKSLGYPMNWIPGNVAQRLLGGHSQRIAELIADHGDEVTVISAHDSIAFKKLTAEAA